MEKSQRKNMSMVIVLVVSAIFCAAATLIAITLVSNREKSTEFAQSTFPETVLVNDTLITLATDPEKAIFLPNGIESAAPDSVDQVMEESQLEGEPVVEEVVPEQSADPIVQPTAQQSDIIFISYTVQSGDTLYSVASSTNSSIELLAINGIDSGDIVAGTTIQVPAANPAYCPGMRTYVVRENDTVFSLARIHGTTTDQIIAANNLDANATIYTSEVLCIP